MDIVKWIPQRATAALKLFAMRPLEPGALRSGKQEASVSAAPGLPEEQVGARQILMKWFAHIWILQS